MLHKNEVKREGNKKSVKLKKRKPVSLNSKNWPQPVKLDSSLKKELQEEASAANVSLHKYIIKILSEWVENNDNKGIIYE